MAKTMKEMLGTELADIMVTFSSGRIIEITEVKAWNECQNILSLKKENKETVIINTDNIDCMAIKPRYGDIGMEQEAADNDGRN